MRLYPVQAHSGWRATALVTSAAGPCIQAEQRELSCCRHHYRCEEQPMPGSDRLIVRIDMSLPYSIPCSSSGTPLYQCPLVIFWARKEVALFVIGTPIIARGGTSGRHARIQLDKPAEIRLTLDSHSGLATLYFALVIYSSIDIGDSRTS
jgi:hypothetical protein